MTTHPLRLAVGSHHAGSGKCCAMNVISWENGDTRITDLPACADPFLAKIVQRVNDSHCKHLEGDLLCPPCLIEVLALAHRTVGTALDPAPRSVCVRIAAEEALRVLPIFEVEYPGDDRPRKAVEAALAWADNPSEKNRKNACTTAATAAAAYADADDPDRLGQAHRIIDRYYELTGLTEQTPDPQVTQRAVEAMLR